MKTPIRFAIWIWNRGIDDFVTYCLPSILQPNNIPWLIRNGYPVALDFYTISWSAEVIQRLAGSLETQLRGLADGADVTTTMFVIDAAPGSYELKTSFFKTLVRRGIDTQSHGLFVFADMYYGDGSIRNIVTYGQKPRVTVSGLYLRVKRARFSELLDRHHAVTGGTTISNARLVDIAFDCLIDGMKASIVDDDRNASYSTSGSIRRITDELYTYTFHAPTPILFFFEEQDAKFFARFDWNVYLLDHIWPSMLIAQNRWRVMASSDLFFLAELNAAELETDVHTHPTKPGMRYNDEYGHEHLNGRVHQTLLMTLRRERLAGTATA